MNKKPENVKELMDQYHQYKKLNEDYEQRVQVCLEQKLLARQDNKILKKTIKEYEKQIADLEKIKNGLNQDNKSLEISNDSHLKQVKDLETIKNVTLEENRQIKDLLQESKEENKLLIDTVNSLKSQLINYEKMHKMMNEQVEDVINSIDKIEKELDRVNDTNCLEKISFEPEIYLKGKFLGFDFDRKLLKILLENKEYFYPLEMYQNEYLPMYNSRILVFKSNNDEIKIYGFNYSKMIPEAKRIQCSIKALTPHKLQLKLMTKEYGYITVSMKEETFNKNGFKPSESIILKETYIDGNYHFTIESNNMIQYNSKEILNLIKG